MKSSDAPVMVHVPEVARLIGRSRQTVAAMLKRGELPSPALNGRNKAWPRATMLAFLGLTGEPAVAGASK